MQGKKYTKRKVEKVAKMMQRTVIGDTHFSDRNVDGTEMIEQLKERFSTAIRSERLHILTVLPKSSSIQKVQDEFSTSNFMARKAKQLVKEKEFLPLLIPNQASLFHKQQLIL